MGGIKSFFRKVWGGIKKAGRFVKDKVLPTVGRIAKPILGVIGALPGKIGMIGKIGSGIANVLHGATQNIPNEDARKKIDDVIARGNERFQGVVDRGRDIANGANNAVGVARDVANGIRDQVKDIPKVIGNLPKLRPAVVDPGFYVRPRKS